MLIFASQLKLSLMKKRVKKETFCIRIQPDVLELVDEVAVLRGLSASVVIEKCILNSFTIMDLKYLDKCNKINNTLNDLIAEDNGIK